MAKIHNPHDENNIKLVNQTALDGEISTLENAISTETSRARGEETKLAGDLTNEINRATDAETKLTNDLAAEVTRASGTEAELDERLSAEISGRETAINEIKTVIGDINENTTVANLIADNTSAINSEITRASDEEDLLNTMINNEITRSTAKDSALEDSINQEISRATAAEDSLNTAINNEITRATAAEEIINIKIGPINERFEQKFENNSTSPVSCRGFGDIINNGGFLKSVTVYCPGSGNTSQSVYLKVFEKTTAPHIFRGISDAPLTHGLNNTLKYTFENSSIILEKNKEYFFVFSTEAQKESTQFSNGNSDSVDCCIKRASKPNTTPGGLLGSSGYSRADLQSIYVIEQESSLSKLAEDNKVSISTLNVEVEKIKNNSPSIYSNLEEAALHTKDNCNAKGIQFIAPENGYLTDLYIGCRDNNMNINTNPQYAKLWDITNGYGVNAVLKAVSLNTQVHNINASEDYDLKYNFKNVELIKGNKYAVSTVLEANKDDVSISAGLIDGCYKTFNLKNSGILKAAFINDNATGEKALSHSPILSLTMISEIAKKIDEKLDIEDALTQTDIDDAISAATADFVNTTTLSSTLENYQLKSDVPSTPVIYKFNRDKDINLTFGETDETLTDTVILTVDNDINIITANAVGDSFIVVSQEILDNVLTLTVLINKPAVSASTHIIVDSICDSAAYDNAQHVCHVIPVTITV